MKLCSNCNSKVPTAAKFCKYCRSTKFKELSICKYCKEPLPNAEANFCLNCGKKLNVDAKVKMKQIIAKDSIIHNCNICRLKIEYDQVVCPSCLNTFHFNHLANWILTNNTCPICKKELELAE